MISIVLVNPQLPENIGFTCRSMLNFGLKNLIIIDAKLSKNLPPLSLNNIAELVKNTDKNSLNSLNITIESDISIALKNFTTILALSARSRYLTKPALPLNGIFSNINNTENIAIMFGGEKNGLSNEQLQYANYLVNIDTNTEYSSLNLSHAVVLVAYEYFNFINKNNPSNIKNNHMSANAEQLEYFFNDLVGKLEQKNFFSNQERKNITINNIKTIYQKSNLSKQEVDTLLAINKFLYNNKN
jgi:tRNA/rRNA methyltransferase